MLKLRQIAYTSIISTSRTPRWWILALMQLVGFLPFPPVFTRPHLAHSAFIFWILAGVFILIPSTVLLWLEIESMNVKEPKKISPENFTNACLRVGGLVVCSLAVVVLARLISFSWLFLAFLSSVISATAVLGMLYIVLCGQDFSSAVVLAFDTWNKKISLAAAIALVLILANGVSFAFAHIIRGSFHAPGQFSVSSHSATIWILFLLLLALTVFLTAVLNCFLVLLFLDIINRKKDPETVEQPATKLATAHS